MIIKGKVQGVGFRYSVLDFVNHSHLEVTGYVRNLKDRDKVEVVAHGEEDCLNKLYSFCCKGPTLARVENVHVEKIEMKESYFSEFKVSY